MKNITSKWIVSIILSVSIATFIMNILNNIGINVWLARIIGACLAAVIELFLYYLFIKK